MEQCGRVTLPMRQHIGEPCAPCVRPGERVLAGQLVADSGAKVCAPVHASISGTVISADDQAVVIESDGEMRRIETKAPEVNSLEGFIQCVRKSGLVGLGGAGFPSHAKLENAASAGVDILLVNAAECEPYVTADYREALDNADDLNEGMEHICHWLCIEKSITGGENGRYPHGAEKMLVHALTKRVVPLGKLPIDVGVLVMNVSSVAFLGRYMRTGMPLISRTVTVDGAAVPRPMNLRAPIGVSLREMLAFCGMGDIHPAKIIIGGPMTGQAQPDLDSVITKCDNAVLLFDAKQARPKPETACIRCGCCVMACPMKLEPLRLEKAYLRGDTQALETLYIDACMECGCCAYVCPAGRELVQKIQQGKELLRRGHGLHRTGGRS